jgi:hypothetical protein
VSARRTGAALAAALVLTLGACAGGSGGEPPKRLRVFNVERIPYGQLGALRGGPGALELVGADAATTAAVAETLQMPPSLGAARFEPAPPGRNGPRLVLATGGGSPDCAGPGAPGSGGAEVSALWCNGTRVQARGQARGEALAEPGTEAFGRAVNQMLSSMLSPQRPSTPGR